MADFYVRHDAAGGGTGLLGWADAFDIAGLKTRLETLAVADDYYWIRGGTYTLPAGGINSGRDGTIDLPIQLIGVNPGTTNEPPVPSDLANNANRPLIEGPGGAGLPFNYDNYWRVHNLQLVGVSALRVDIAGVISNCRVATESIQAIYIGDFGVRIFGSEVSCTGGIGIRAITSLSLFGSYIHNCLTDCVSTGENGCTLLNNIFDTAVTGWYPRNRKYHTIAGNVFYNLALGIDGLDVPGPDRITAFNNIFHTCAVPVSWSTNVLSNYWDWNCWWNSGAPANVTPGPNALYVDPQFVDAPGGDFRIGLNLFTRGFGIRDGVATPSLPNPGAWQGRLPTVVPVGIDLSQDQLFLDNLESVTLNGILEENVYRLSMTTKEGDPSYAAYLQTDVIWQFIPDGVIEPEVGDPIIDDSGAGVEFRILEVRKPFMNNYWNCVSRKVGITEAVGLRDLITLWPVVVDPSEPYGSRIATHPAADPDFTDVPAKVQIRPVEIIVEAGKQQFRRQFDIYVDRDIDVSIGDLLKDQNLIQYDITSFQNRDRVDKLSHIVAEYTD